MAGALTSSYGVLVATRVAGAFVYAGFWAVASVTAIELAGPAARAKAMSVLASGLTVATIVGLPAGTLLGQHLGWRSAFWAVAVLSVLAIGGVVATIPGDAQRALRQLRLELRSMANPQLWLAYGTTALSTGAILVIFSYLAPLLTETTGLSAAWVPVILALYGVGALAGITISGRTADQRPFSTLLISLAGVIAAAIVLALGDRHTLARHPRDHRRRDVRLRHQSGGELAGVQRRRIRADARRRLQHLGVQRRHHGRSLARRPGDRRGRGLSAVGWIGAGLGVLAFGTIPLAVRAAGRTAQPAYESASSMTGA